jgi:isoleucyl-tRNA synthetase
MTESKGTRRFAPLHEGIAESPSAAEMVTLESWRASGTFAEVEKARAGAPSFVFWEGPPTANGRPGIHHVMARTIKDVVCRFQTMQGKRVVRKAGWDTHGLPVELEVEKKLGISGKPQIEQYGVAAFNAKCRESVWTYKKEWEELSERTGYWLDYAHPYVTYEADYVESVWYLLSRFHGAGLVYRGKRVLPYCGRCGTGLSSHELGQPGVYRDVMDPSVHVRFRLRASLVAKVDPKLARPGEQESVLAWTTTPWTLPSNIALAVHPEQSYSAIRMPRAGGDTEILWIAAARIYAPWGAKELEKLKADGGGEVLATLTGRELVGAKYEPLFDAVGARVPEIDPGAWKPERTHLHSIVAANYVSMEDGTGVVHQAAAYGVDDWETARAHRLPVLQAVGGEGRFVCDVASVKAGTLFKEADKPLTIDLKERGLLLKSDHASHSYPHCWRCDTPLFYFASPAWYIRTTAYKERMIEQNRAIRWIPPDVGEKRFGEWLENNVDWNISRDRYWGTPLPFWVCDNVVDGSSGRRSCDHVVAIGSVEELHRRAGSLPDGFDNHKPLIDEIVFDCEQCGGKRSMKRTKAVLDCWFDSGAMPYAQYHWPFGEGRDKVSDQFPADFIAEGLDQTRGWFYTLHAIGAFVSSLPDARLPSGPTFKTCAVNGLVLDKDGVKMSKRLGNVIDPWKVLDEHGADAVRWYLLSSGQPWLPKRFDPSGLAEVRRKFLGTLINSYKFFAEYARIDDFDPSDPRIPRPADRTEIDRWILSRTQSLIEDVRARMLEYDLAAACRAIESFVIDDLSNWYIRRNRRRFWKSDTGADKLAAFSTLYSALTTTTLLMAPVAPFLSEMLWERLAPGQGSVHVALFPTAHRPLVLTPLEESMRVVVRIVEMGRALRERAVVKTRQPLRAIHIRASRESDLVLLRTPFAVEQILAELNVKAIGSLATDDGHLCRLKAKANFKVLGPRLGAQMKGAARAIEALAPSEVARLRAGQTVSVDVDGPLAVGPDDVQITVETQATFDVETDGRFVVYLDLELDDALVSEGLAREAINRINGLRKDGGLLVEDRIRLHLDASGDPLLARALVEHGELIRAETLAVELSTEVVAPNWGASEEFDLGAGRRLTVQLRRN